jgi:hypothetical protein
MECPLTYLQTELVVPILVLRGLVHDLYVARDHGSTPGLFT